MPSLFLTSTSVATQYRHGLYRSTVGAASAQVGAGGSRGMQPSRKMSQTAGDKLLGLGAMVAGLMCVSVDVHCVTGRSFWDHSTQRGRTFRAILTRPTRFCWDAIACSTRLLRFLQAYFLLGVYGSLRRRVMTCNYIGRPDTLRQVVCLPPPLHLV